MKTKTKEMDFNYNTFNSKKFIHTFKKKTEQSIYLCRLKITNNDKDAIETYKEIFKQLSSIVRNPIVFQNDLIHITIIEVGSFIDFLGLFSKSITNVRSEDGLRDRQKSFFDKQEQLLSHLKEINENPTGIPNFIKSLI